MSQLQITFRGMAPSENLCALAEARFLKVRQKCVATSGCHLLIERPAEALEFSARVQLGVGGNRFNAVAESRHNNANIAVREAFERASAQVVMPTKDTAVVRQARLLARPRSRRSNHLVLVR